MKNSLFFILTLCTVISTAQAQYNDPRRDDRGNSRDDKWIDSDALENQALQGLENAARSLRNEIQNNGNYGYGSSANGNRGGDRGSYNAIDLLSMSISIENSVRNLRDLTRGARTRRNEPSIRAESANLKTLSASMINAIPSLARRSANLIDNIGELVKAVGAVQLALNAPRSAGPGQVVVVGPPIDTNVTSAFCSVSFQHGGYSYMASGEGINLSLANAKLWNNCGNIGGSYGSISNAQACQSKLSQSKCVDAFEYARSQDPQGSRFTNCTVSFQHGGYSYTANGAGPNVVAGISSLWDNCKTIGGSYGSISNAEACKSAVANQKFGCSVH